jgi:hypothetical protein
MRSLGIPNNKMFYEVTKIEDALQLWCVEKKRLRWLLQQPWFFPRNRLELQDIAR